jgi:hypothetical protein
MLGYLGMDCAGNEFEIGAGLAGLKPGRYILIGGY